MSGPVTAAARFEATAERAVPAGAVTSTSQARPEPWPAYGARTVSRICIAVSGPFCARWPGRGKPPCVSPHPARTRRPVQVGTARGLPTPSMRRAGGILAPATDDTPAGRSQVILNGRPWTRNSPVGHAFGACVATVVPPGASSSGQVRDRFRPLRAPDEARTRHRNPPVDDRPATRSAALKWVGHPDGSQQRTGTPGTHREATPGPRSAGSA